MREPASSIAVRVVIVAYNSGEVLATSVDRALAAEGVREVVIVDNGSDDGAVDALRAEFPDEPRLRMLRNAGNPGFAVACNQGAKGADVTWLAFLNPDCYIERDTFARMLASIDDPARIGVLGADVHDAQGVPEDAARRRDPVPGRAIPQALGLMRREESYVAPSPGSSGLTAVDAISGALMLMPRVNFERLGGFDEGYRLHCEDLDLCRRARGLGLVVAVVEDARVIHLKGTSSKRRPYFVQWMKHRGMWRYYRKFDAPSQAWPLRVIIGVGIFASACARILRAWCLLRLGREP